MKEYIQDLDKINTKITLYVESCTNAIDALENESIVRNTIFTENSDDKDLFQKIIESIKNIFNKLKDMIGKGKIKGKQDLQTKMIKDLKPSVDQISDVKITIQNVWSFYQFSNKTIDECIKHPNEKKISVLNKQKGSKKVIASLTDSFNRLAKAMRTPSARQFSVEKKSLLKTSAKIAGSIAAEYGTMLGLAVVSDREIDKYLKKINPRYDEMNKMRYKEEEIPDGDVSLLSSTGEGFKEIRYDPDKKKYIGTYIKMLDDLDPSERERYDKLRKETGSLYHKHKRTQKNIDNIGKLSVIVEIIAIVDALFNSNIKSGIETVSAGDLYKRLVDLKAGNVVSDTTSMSNITANYLSRTDSLQKIAQDKASDNVKFAQSISSLILAYANFYQALIDFYISILKSVISIGGVKKGKIYKPAEIVKTNKR